jgi:hypothetical protein
MAAARKVEVIIIPELHNPAFLEILKQLIPELKTHVPRDYSKILNFVEGEGVEGKKPGFFNAMYGSEKFIQMFEYREGAPDIEYIHCLKLILTVCVLLENTLDAPYLHAKSGRDVREISGIDDKPLSEEYYKLLVTQAYKLPRLLPKDAQSVRFLELLDSAFQNIFAGKLDKVSYDDIVNEALTLFKSLFAKKGCDHSDVLIPLIQQMIDAGTAENRIKIIPDTVKPVIGNYLDTRIIQKIERFLMTRPEITHVIMNIGENHYKNTVKKIKESEILSMEGPMNTLFLEIYRSVGLAKHLEGGRRKRTRKNRKNIYKIRKSKKRRSHKA